jgi:hypothetical protein
LDKTIEILFDELTFSDQLTLFYFFYKQSDSKSKRVKEILLTSIIFNLLIFVTILFVVLCFWYIFIKRGA